MKFALVDQQLKEAQKSLAGICPHCKSSVIAKCGDKNVDHWAHKGKRDCDQWWENETEWHRSWKRQFPIEWQEITHWAEDGEIHRADVKTKDDWVIEFQHSHLSPEERKARNDFYPKLIWVVNGVRRKRDSIQFFKLLKEEKPISSKPLTYPVWQDFSTIIGEWAGNKPVFFDFGEPGTPEESFLWYLPPNQSSGFVNVIQFERTSLIKYLHGEPTPGIDYNEYLIPGYISPEAQRLQAEKIETQRIEAEKREERKREERRIQIEKENEARRNRPMVRGRGRL